MGIKKSVCLFFILLMASCSNDGIMEKMEQIKTFGNGNPEMALTMLDSLELDTTCSESDSTTKPTTCQAPT